MTFYGCGSQTLGCNHVWRTINGIFSLVIYEVWSEVRHFNKHIQ